jgi:hypothetical protein
MRLFKYLFNRKGVQNKRGAIKPVKKNVAKVTSLTLKQYSKTFSDLARYDRREKVFN